MQTNLVNSLFVVIFALAQPILGIFTERCHHQQLLQVSEVIFHKRQNQKQKFLTRCWLIQKIAWQVLNNWKGCVEWSRGDKGLDDQCCTNRVEERNWNSYLG